MKRVTYLLEPEQGYFDEGELVLREHGVELRTVHQLQVLADGTAIGLYAYEGDPEAVETAMGGEKVIDFAQFTGPEGPMLWLHWHPGPLLAELFDAYRNLPVSWQFPLEHTHEGDTTLLRDSMVGAMADLREHVDNYRDIDGLDLHIERVESFTPGRSRLLDSLTERQREVFRAAFEQGYYEVPREATHADIAADFDCSASAVGRTLQRVEAAFAAAALPDHERVSARQVLEN